MRQGIAIKEYTNTWKCEIIPLTGTASPTEP
jgi:hypothetical protein